MRKASTQSIRSSWRKASKYEHKDVRIKLAPVVGFLQELVSDPGTHQGKNKNSSRLHWKALQPGPCAQRQPAAAPGERLRSWQVGVGRAPGGADVRVAMGRQ